MSEPNEASEASQGEQFVIDVGSSLSSADWQDIDNKDVVAKTKSSDSFKLMLVIQPYEASASGRGCHLLAERLFEWLYVQRNDGDVFKDAAKNVFPTLYEYARENKEFKAQMKASSVEKVETELADASKHSEDAAYTLQFASVLTGATMSAVKILNLRRFSIDQGEDSIEDSISQLVWAKANKKVKHEVSELMYDYSNKPDAGPVPRRYKHQEDLMRSVTCHLQAVTKAQTRPELADGATGFAALPPLPSPLHMILSTPTGSGKTFTAIMLHLQLLKQQFPDIVMVYSVPTKQVLKRVGQECEAHNIPYWTAAKDGDLHQVRRPYSIRTKRTKGEKGAGSGTISEQLKLAGQMGAANQDHGNGKPSIIIADIYSTAAMLKAAHTSETNRSAPFHYANILLYFDEPNMGIHLDEKVMAMVKTIMQYKAQTTILASATLPDWEELPSWWKGAEEDETPAVREVVTQAPYGLPMSQLHVFNESENKVRSVSPLSLFPSYSCFKAAMEKRKRLRILLLRHMAPAQAQEVLSGNPDVSAEAAELMKWTDVYGSVRSLRETLEPKFGVMDYEGFHTTRGNWRNQPPPRPAFNGLNGVLSSVGVTMIACTDPRRLAMELAGSKDEEAWHDEIHKINNRVKEVERTHKQAQKDKDRVKRVDMSEESSQTETGSMTLRPGLSINVADTNEVDPSSLVMLSKGIVYACAEGTEPLVKKLYQQALLAIPEKAMAKKQPPIHTLVVDYSSVYGTDCPAVDTIIMCDDLGQHLTWEDHQQFLGRLRRDGIAIYLSMKTLRKAALGDLKELSLSPQPDSLLFEIIFDAFLHCQCKGMNLGKTYTELNQVRQLEGGGECSDGQLACYMFASLLRFALPPPSDAVPSTSAQYAAPLDEGADVASKVKSHQQSLVKLLKTWAPLFKKLVSKSEAFQVEMIETYAAVCEGRGEFGGAWFKGHEDAVLGMCGGALKMLYDDDVLSEEAIVTWANKARDLGLMDKSTFCKKVAPFVTWLEEAEEDDDDEDDSDEESDEEE